MVQIHFPLPTGVIVCNCKSKPDYHREDCLEFDIYGGKKNRTSSKNNINKLFYYIYKDKDGNEQTSNLLSCSWEIFNRNRGCVFVKKVKY